MYSMVTTMLPAVGLPVAAVNVPYTVTSEVPMLSVSTGFIAASMVACTVGIAVRPMFALPMYRAAEAAVPMVSATSLTELPEMATVFSTRNRKILLPAGSVPSTCATGADVSATVAARVVI